MRSPMLALVVLSLGVAGIAYATRTTPTTDTAVATLSTLGPVQESDGWCVDVAVGAPVDLMASIPTRITATERGRIRHVSVLHGPSTPASANVCVRVADSTELDCASNAGIAGLLSTEGEALSYVIVADTAGAQLPAIYADAATVTVTTCVDVAW